MKPTWLQHGMVRSKHTRRQRIVCPTNLLIILSQLVKTKKRLDSKHTQKDPKHKTIDEIWLKTKTQPCILLTFYFIGQKKKFTPMFGLRGWHAPADNNCLNPRI